MKLRLRLHEGLLLFVTLRYLIIINALILLDKLTAVSNAHTLIKCTCNSVGSQQ
jgi:hypothetical protein